MVTKHRITVDSAEDNIFTVQSPKGNNVYSVIFLTKIFLQHQLLTVK
jgi:hypothetical protein